MMSPRSIKNRVLIHFWILFFLSMLLIDVMVFVVFLERAISRHREEMKRELTVLCSAFTRKLAHSGADAHAIEERLLPSGDRFLFMMGGNAPHADDNLSRAVTETLKEKSTVTRSIGKVMGLFHPQAEYLIVTMPVVTERKLSAAGGLQSGLSPIYKDFRRLHIISLVFLLINSLFFALVGNRQLSRIYFSPLSRLARKAESYQDEENLFFSVRKEDNEFSILSSSLNKMLQRIADNKRTLTDTIRSLKIANSELKKAQEDVIRAEKLATVGRLTSGIAHEIGNPVGIVLGYLDLLKQTDLDPHERKEFICRGEQEITRINTIIRQLLDMSRHPSGELKLVSVHSLLEELVAVLKFQASVSRIAFEARFNATRDLIFADPDQLRQVFLNILMNAVDAVNAIPQDSPSIAIRTETGVDTRMIGNATQEIRVTIRDNGPGVGPEHIGRIFDPFYTTKPPGKGTGLGLSVSYMIVEKIGGRLSVDSAINDGAAFIVSLPLSDEPTD